jgi:hypothetical protein
MLFKKSNLLAERAGIEPATDGFIRLLSVLKTDWNTSPVLSIFVLFHYKNKKYYLIKISF